MATERALAEILVGEGLLFSYNGQDYKVEGPRLEEGKWLCVPAVAKAGSTRGHVYLTATDIADGE